MEFDKTLTSGSTKLLLMKLLGTGVSELSFQILPGVIVSTALIIGFGLMTIYSLVFFVKDLKRSNHGGEVDA